MCVKTSFFKVVSIAPDSAFYLIIMCCYSFLESTQHTTFKSLHSLFLLMHLRRRFHCDRIYQLLVKLETLGDDPMPDQKRRNTHIYILPTPGMSRAAQDRFHQAFKTHDNRQPQSPRNSPDLSKRRPNVSVRQIIPRYRH